MTYNSHKKELKINDPRLGELAEPYRVFVDVPVDCKVLLPGIDRSNGGDGGGGGGGDGDDINPYVILVKTDNTGITSDEQFRLPATGTYDVDWGDGNVETLSGVQTHTYATAGNYVIKVWNGLTQITFATNSNNGGDRLKLLEVQRWGDITWSSFDRAYEGCANCRFVAPDPLVLPPSCWRALQDCSSFNESVANWDFSAVLDMDSMFEFCTSVTSFALIDTSSVIYMGGAWSNCHSLTSFPAINTSNVIDMSATWINCYNLPVFPWIDTSAAIDMNFTWEYCSSLTTFPTINPVSAREMRQCWGSCTGLTSFPGFQNGVGVGCNMHGAWFSCNSLTEFPWIDLSNGDDFRDTWAEIPGLTAFPLLPPFPLALTFNGAWFNCTGLASFPANFFNGCPAWDYTDTFYTTNLTQTSIDDILVSIDSNLIVHNPPFESAGFLQSQGTAPSATGEAAVDAMRARGWAVRVTGKYYNPLGLFGNGEVGAWYDPSDLTTLFQDAAGTVPVTTDGDPVRLMQDKSGNDNHATAPSDDARPLYKTDAGLHWLQFDGVDDSMDTAAIDFTGGDKMTVFTANQWDRVGPTPSQVFIELSENSFTTDGTFSMVQGEASNNPLFVSSRGTIHDAISKATPGITTGQKVTFTLAADISAPFCRMYENAIVAGSNLSQGTGNYSNNKLYIGSRAGTGNFFLGRAYGIIIRAAETSLFGDIRSAEIYLADKIGIVLNVYGGWDD